MRKIHDVVYHRPALHKAVKALLITLLAFLFSIFLVSPFTASTSAIFSSPEQSDFQFSDIYAQVADARPVRQLVDKVVILDIGNANRNEIAEALTTLSLCDYKAVGVDIMFARPHDDDSALIEAVSSIPGIVLPVAVVADSVKPGSFAESEHPFLRDIDPAPDAVYAAINLPTANNSGHGRVREFPFGFPTARGDTIPSFAMALVARAFPEKAKAMLSGSEMKLPVNYPSQEFTIITPDQLLDNPEAVSGSIVIVGALNDAYDMHATPVNSYMPGTTIHAHAVATILSGIRYSQAPRQLDKVTAALVCFLLIYLCLSLSTSYRGLVVRTAQLLFLFLVVWLGYVLYVDRYFIVNFSYTFLMIAFGLFALDLYNGSRAAGAVAFNKIKSKLKKTSK